MSDLVIYDGRQIPAPMIDGKRFVAMRPIVEGMGLDWKDQLNLIRRDEVLNSTVVITTTVAEDGKIREMVCLPEEFLQGWLFKVPASRYTGERKEKIIRYQRECYKALHDYWTKGAAINPAATMKQMKAMGEKIAKQARHIQFFGNRTIPGTPSEVNGKPRMNPVHGYLRSSRTEFSIMPNGLAQLTFEEFFSEQPQKEA